MPQNYTGVWIHKPTGSIDSCGERNRDYKSRTWLSKAFYPKYLTNIMDKFTLLFHDELCVSQLCQLNPSTSLDGLIGHARKLLKKLCI